MKILFHTNTLNFAGTTVAVLDYAKYNQEILGNESVIIHTNDSHPYIKDMSNEPSAIENIKKQMEVRVCNGWNDYDLHTKDIDLCYFLRFGTKDYLPKNKKTAVHTVFHVKDPHGDAYAYVSPWLSKYASGYEIPYVPHIVQMPTPTNNYRKKLGIANDKIIIAKFGSYNSFDIQFAIGSVINAVTAKNDLYFVFVNSPKFINHPRVIFLDEIIDLQEKSNFINSCDAMIHARSPGETFGLAVCEFLFHNKPVIAHNSGSMGRHHIDMLCDTGLLYNNEDELLVRLLSVQRHHSNDYTKIVQPFSPSMVMQKFKKIFIGD